MALMDAQGVRMVVPFDEKRTFLENVSPWIRVRSPRARFLHRKSCLYPLLAKAVTLKLSCLKYPACRQPAMTCEGRVNYGRIGYILEEWYRRQRGGTAVFDGGGDISLPDRIIEVKSVWLGRKKRPRHFQGFTFVIPRDRPVYVCVLGYDYNERDQVITVQTVSDDLPLSDFEVTQEARVVG